MPFLQVGSAGCSVGNFGILNVPVLEREKGSFNLEAAGLGCRCRCTASWHFLLSLIILEELLWGFDYFIIHLQKQIHSGYVRDQIGVTEIGIEDSFYGLRISCGRPTRRTQTSLPLAP